MFASAITIPSKCKTLSQHCVKINYSLTLPQRKSVNSQIGYQTIECQHYVKPVHNTRIQHCDNIMALSHVNLSTTSSSQCCCYTMLYTHLTSTLSCAWWRCHNVVTMLYPNIVYRYNITLSFDGLAIYIGFTSRQLQATTFSQLWKVVTTLCVCYLLV